MLSLGYGMLSTVHALETPGGDDDRQWLTYWVIIALLSALESFAAVLLTAARMRLALRLGSTLR